MSNVSKRQGITIEYDGTWPNLCGGTLYVTVGGKRWLFPYSCLTSGGSIEADADWNFEVLEGEWSVAFPSDFPKELEDRVTDAVNMKVPSGCCGGCI